MLSTTVFILFISTLVTNEVHVFAISRLFCSKTPPNCTCAIVDSSNALYECKDEDRSEGVDLYSTPSEEIKITCDDSTTSMEWYNLLEGIDLSEDYKMLTIQKCPIPEESLKDLLARLSVGRINTLCIDYTTGPKNNYQADHFLGLDFVTSFYFRFNNVTSFPGDALVGLPNIQNLFLNENYLQKIAPNFFQSVPKVTFLDLAGNNLTELETDIFKPLESLQTLNLNHNKLRNLSREIFTPLRNLARLDLNNNDMTMLNVDIFRDLSTLTVLNLGFNNITVLPEGVLSGLKSLKLFRARESFNERLKTLPAGLFHGLKSLQEIVIELNKIIYLPDAIFSGLTKLTNLTLNRNRLTELPSDLFRNTTNLKKIELSYNKLTILKETLFQGLGKLTTLYLDHNEISFIHGSAFDDLKSLTHLNLANNQLSHLEHNVFHHLQNLRVIYLDNNRLDMSSDLDSSVSVLTNCKNLEGVHLRNNSVDRIFTDWRSALVYLKHLDLSHNKFQTVETTDFSFMRLSTDSLDVKLDYNNITLVDLEHHEQYVRLLACTSGICDNDPIQALKISLQNNPINCDCRNYDFIRYIQGKMSSNALEFMKIPNKEELECDQPKHMSNVKLIEIDLANFYCVTECPGNCTCQFRAADQVTVVNCTKVKELPTWLPNNTEVELILAHNELENLREVSPLINSNVTKLSLSWNSLKNINDLNVSHSLKVLELDHNQMSTLSKSNVNTLTRTRARISLYGNPWKCDCDAKYLLMFMKERFAESLLHGGNDIICEGSGERFIHQSEDYLCSKYLYVYIICISLTTFGFLFGALTFLYLKFEHKIKVFMFAHGICLWWVTEKEVDRDKKFDAFISYVHQDEEFVVEELLPNLENGPHKYDLCVHYRDWIVGDFIPEQIIRSVGSSRRTIIVLSQNYLKSRWADLEFRTAYLQGLEERHPRLIVILLEDLDPTVELGPEMKTYITNNTYLKKDDSQFWDRLRFALPHPQYGKLKSIKRKGFIVECENYETLMGASDPKDAEIEKIKIDA